MARWRALCPAQSSQSEPELPTPPSIPPAPINLRRGWHCTIFPCLAVLPQGPWRPLSKFRVQICPIFYFCRVINNEERLLEARSALLTLFLAYALTLSLSRPFSILRAQCARRARSLRPARACMCTAHSCVCGSCVQHLRQRAAWPWRQR
jgi:hypothetical protein